MAADNLMSFCMLERLYPILGKENGYSILDQVPFTRTGIGEVAPTPQITKPQWSQ